MEGLIRRLNDWQTQPDPPPLSQWLDDPCFKEFVDSHSLSALEQDPDFAGDVVPLADGLFLAFDLSTELWSEVTRP